MDKQIFVDHDGIKWERSGECCRCGECCFGDPFDGKEGESEICGACPLLTLLPDKLYACTDRQNSYYLSGCNTFPEHPTQIVNYPSCSYTFKRLN